MKRFSILCCLVLLIGLMSPAGLAIPLECSHDLGYSLYVQVEGGHQGTCPDCGEIGYDGRVFPCYARCNAPGVCYMACGNENANLPLIHGEDEDLEWREVEGGHQIFCHRCNTLTEGVNIHTYDQEIKQVDGGHQGVCICGATSEVIACYAPCSAPGICEGCGREDASIYPYHTGENSYVQAEGGHQSVWSCCREPGEVYPCYAPCTAPGTCETCGRNDETVETYHAAVPAYIQAEGGHQSVWRCCGEPGEVYPCYAPCSAPGTCETCGRNDETVQLYHSGDITCVPVEGGHKESYSCCNTVFGRLLDHYTAEGDQEGVCSACGAEYTPPCPHDSYVVNMEKSDSGYEWQECEDCGEFLNKVKHNVSCQDPTTCRRCGMTGVATSSVRHNVGDFTRDNLYCWQECADCGQRYGYTRHFASCLSDDDACEYCQASGVNIDLYHEGIHYEDRGSGHVEVCICGETLSEIVPHYRNCTDTMCGCGITYTGDNVEHGMTYFGGYDDNRHWHVCSRCGEEVGYESHWMRCGEQELCAICHAQGVDITVRHVGDVETDYDETHHWDVCGRCDGRPIRKAHTWDEGTQQGNEIVYACSGCDATKREPVTTPEPDPTPTPEPDPTPTPEPDPTPTPEPDPTPRPKPNPTPDPIPVITPEPDPVCSHDWYDYEEKAATCEEAGYLSQACSLCEELNRTEYPATGHAFGLIYTAQGDATHAAACGQCDAVNVVPCELVTTDLGMMLCSACPTCGYTVYGVKEEAGLAADVAAQTEVKRVEEAVMEAAEEANVADVALIVHETELAITVELPSQVEANVRKVLTVSLVKEGRSIQPAALVKISLPCVEEELEGLALMLIGEDGQLVQIPYEIVEGMLVFETELVGVFLFVEAPQAA